MSIHLITLEKKVDEAMEKYRVFQELLNLPKKKQNKVQHAANSFIQSRKYITYRYNRESRLAFNRLCDAEEAVVNSKTAADEALQEFVKAVNYAKRAEYVLDYCKKEQCNEAVPLKVFNKLQKKGIAKPLEVLPQYLKEMKV